MAKATGREQLTEREREVVDALCRPLREEGPAAGPASNRQIADEVFLSLDAVKGHLRTIYAKLGLDGLRQNEKRARLAALGLRGELDPPRQRSWRPRPSAAVAPVLAAAPFALLAALALAGVVSAPTGGGGASEGPPATAPGNGFTEQAGGGRGTSRAEGPVLVEQPAVGVLPVELVNESVSPTSAAAVETLDGAAPRPAGPDGGRGQSRRVAKRPKPKPRPKAAPPVAPPAAARAQRCVNHLHRTVHRRVVYRWRWRRVRQRVAHRHFRVRREVFLHPHQRVWVNKKGRRQVRRWQHRHVREVREPYTHWHTRWKRKRVKAPVVVRRVETRNHPHCG